jgi:hypothetical protein
MILQRTFDAVLSALEWLVNLLFPQIFVLVIALSIVLGAFLVLAALRYRARGS